MFTLAILASFAFYLIVGVAVGRGIKTTDDYYVAGRRAPSFLVTGTLVASFISTVSLMGEVGMSYDGFPIALLLLVTFNFSGYGIGVLLFGRYLRRSESLTVPEYFGRRFDSKHVQALAGIMVILGIGLYLVSVSHGLSLVLQQLIDLPQWAIMLMVWASYTIFTMVSGSRGVLVNDTIMFVIFLVAVLFGMGWVIASAGGPGAVTEKMMALVQKPDALSWHGVTGEGAYLGSPGEVLLYSLTLGLVFMIVVAVSPWQSSRFLMAKNEHVALRSGFLATGSLVVMYIFLAFGGFAINLINPDIEPSDIAFIWIAQNYLPDVLGVIIITGIGAAVLSSASTFLSIIGFSAANDILPVFSRRFRELTHVTTKTGSIATQALTVDPEGAKEADRVKLAASRVVMLMVSIAVLGATFAMPPLVLTIGYFAATLFAASWGAVAIWSTQSRRITARGAAFGMITGFVVSAVLQTLETFTSIVLPTLMNPVILGIGVSIIGILVGNFRNQPSAKALAQYEKMKVTPKEERSRERLRTTGVIAGTVIVVCAIVTAALILYYAIPFGMHSV